MKTVTLARSAAVTLVTLLLNSYASLAQEEVAIGANAYGRAKVNNIVNQGDWIWFSDSGALYRKNIHSDKAELVYGAIQFASAKILYAGRLTNPDLLEYNNVLTSENSGLPEGYIAFRFDDQEVLWVSNRNGTEASFDRAQWIYHTVRSRYEPRLRKIDPGLWSKNTPFAGDSVHYRSKGNERAPDSLLLSIVPRGEPERHWSFPAVFQFDVGKNGTVYAVTKKGLHIFRPLDEGEKQSSAKLEAVSPYPNPATSSITFAMRSDVVKAMTVDICDLTGCSRLQGIEGTTKATMVNVTELEEGVYVAMMKSERATAMTTFTIRR